MKYHPNWTVLDKYIDEGITGTQAKKRPSFLKMIEDAEKGKFDLIVTREVCRFARNTVDTLNFTRHLKNIGVEVFFVEDNIWTMDGDGELRLTIMATLAQEESRKVSERVKAGQQISREKGTVYGNGNILGYKRVERIVDDKKVSKMVIDPEQAETVRMIYDMYLEGVLGTGKIAEKLTEMGRKNASGLTKWNINSVNRILSNQTYMGVMAYGKSRSNNYLEQKRINNYDASTYMLVKTELEPIISEEDFYKAQEIKARRIKPSLCKAIDNRKKIATHGVRENKDLWGSKLQCGCGASFKKNRWHKNKGKPWSYGYQCYNQLNNGTAKKRREAGADDTGYCDMPMIADWRLEMMGKTIMEDLWRNRKDAVNLACELIKKYKKADKPSRANVGGMLMQIERLKQKKDTLTEMRIEGEITKEEYKEQKEKVDREIKELEAEYQKQIAEAENAEEQELCWDKITEALEQFIDFSKPELDREVYKKFVAKIVPISKTEFKWYLNLDGATDSISATVEGRKGKAVVNIGEEKSSPPDSQEITLKAMKKDIDTKKYSLDPALHRQLSRK